MITTTITRAPTDPFHAGACDLPLPRLFQARRRELLWNTAMGSALFRSQGIGATTTVFGLFDALFVRSLDVTAPEPSSDCRS